MKLEESKRQREKKDKENKGKQFGKMPMIRSQPPKVKRFEKKKQKYTEEQQDMIDYGLQAIVELETAQQKQKGEDQ